MKVGGSVPNLRVISVAEEHRLLRKHIDINNRSYLPKNKRERELRSVELCASERAFKLSFRTLEPRALSFTACVELLLLLAVNSVRLVLFHVEALLNPISPTAVDRVRSLSQQMADKGNLSEINK